MIDNIYNKKMSNSDYRISSQEILKNLKILNISKMLPECSALRKTVFIDSNGDIYPCIALPIKIGNIFNNSLEKILKSPYSTFIKRKIYDSQKNVEKNILFCPAINYSENKDFSKIPEYIKNVFNFCKEK